MPRFSDVEKKIISERLFTEGERLFSAFGLRRVSIDELAQAAGIAKGSFYAFYPGKEHLFLAVVLAAHKKLLGEMELFLREHRGLTGTELALQTFLWLFKQYERDPLTRRPDTETADYLLRKLPRETVATYIYDDGATLSKLEKYGVRFSCGIPMATRIMQILTLSFFNMERDETGHAVMHTILQAVLNEIVSDTD